MAASIGQPASRKVGTSPRTCERAAPVSGRRVATNLNPAGARYSGIGGVRRCVPFHSGTFPHALRFLFFNPQLEESMSLEASEAGNLIGSDKVEGTAVYGADRNKIGSIERVMIDKPSGKVSYAVLSFG